MTETRSWYARAKAVADEGVPRNERAFGVFLSVVCTAALLYFFAHQVADTGFYTEGFGPAEMVLLYGFWIFWITTATLEGVLGLRLASRLFDTFGGVAFAAVALAWLLIVFPFDHHFFADMAPQGLRFLVEWISDDVARVFFVIAIPLHAAAAVYTPFAYDFVERKRRGEPEEAAEEVAETPDEAQPDEDSAEAPPRG